MKSRRQISCRLNYRLVSDEKSKTNFRFIFYIFAPCADHFYIENVVLAPIIQKLAFWPTNILGAGADRCPPLSPRKYVCPMKTKKRIRISSFFHQLIR